MALQESFIQYRNVCYDSLFVFSCGHFDEERPTYRHRDCLNCEERQNKQGRRYTFYCQPELVAIPRDEWCPACQKSKGTNLRSVAQTARFGQYGDDVKLGGTHDLCDNDGDPLGLGALQEELEFQRYYENLKYQEALDAAQLQVQRRQWEEVKERQQKIIDELEFEQFRRLQAQVAQQSPENVMNNISWGNNTGSLNRNDNFWNNNNNTTITWNNNEEAWSNHATWSGVDNGQQMDINRPVVYPRRMSGVLPAANAPVDEDDMYAASPSRDHPERNFMTSGGFWGYRNHDANQANNGNPHGPFQSNIEPTTTSKVKHQPVLYYPGLSTQGKKTYTPEGLKAVHDMEMIDVDNLNGNSGSNGVQNQGSGRHHRNGNQNRGNRSGDGQQARGGYFQRGRKGVNRGYHNKRNNGGNGGFNGNRGNGGHRHNGGVSKRKYRGNNRSGHGGGGRGWD